MRTDEVGPAHRMELTAALVEQDLDVAKGLEPGAEARFRLADSLGDRASPPLGEGVQVEHTIGLPKANRAEDDASVFVVRDDMGPVC